MTNQDKKPCISCGAAVPERQDFPYPGHKRGCALVLKWRISEELRVALEHNKAEYDRRHGRISQP